MALFDNVTYEFYTTTLGRSKVPSPELFGEYKLENQLFVKDLVDKGLVLEKQENGIDSAVCMMIEIDYEAAQTVAGNDAVKTSESIAGYSHSNSTKKLDKHIDLNMKSVAEQKYKWLKLFTIINSGVC